MNRINLTPNAGQTRPARPPCILVTTAMKYATAKAIDTKAQEMHEFCARW